MSSTLTFGDETYATRALAPGRLPLQLALSHPYFFFFFVMVLLVVIVFNPTLALWQLFDFTKRPHRSCCSRRRLDLVALAAGRLSRHNTLRRVNEPPAAASPGTFRSCRGEGGYAHPDRAEGGDGRPDL